MKETGWRVDLERKVGWWRFFNSNKSTIHYLIEENRKDPHYVYRVAGWYKKEMSELRR